MMKHWTKLSALLLACGLLFSSCGNSPASSNPGSSGGTAQPESEPGTEPITFTFFDKNAAGKFDDPVAQKIKEETGVSIELIDPTGNSTEKLNLMLAGGDYPDMLLIGQGTAELNKYITSGAALPLDDLIEAHAPNLKEHFTPYLTKTRYEDGKCYFLPSWCGGENTADPVSGILMRLDLMKEMYGEEKATSADIITTEEYRDILKKYKETYGGIPLSMYDDNSAANVLAIFKQIFGMDSYYEKDGKWFYDFRDPRYLEAVSYVNSLVRDGLVDNEWVSLKKETFNQKAANGNVFSYPQAWWVTDANPALMAENGDNPDAGFYMYCVGAPGLSKSEIRTGGRSLLGWDGVVIRKKCADPARAIQFLDYLGSPEGQYLTMWGVEGVSWDMVDGKMTPKQEVRDAYNKDWTSAANQYGVRVYTWMNNEDATYPETPLDMLFKYERAAADLFAIHTSKETVFDNSFYSGLEPVGQTQEVLISQKISDIVKLAVPKMINAASEDEVLALYTQMVADCDAAGADKVEAVITENANQRKELWGLD